MESEDVAKYYESLMRGLSNIGEHKPSIYFKYPEKQNDWTRTDMVQWFAGVERAIKLYNNGHIGEINKILQTYSGTFIEGFKVGLAVAQYKPSGVEPTFTFTDEADEDRKGRFVFREVE